MPTPAHDRESVVACPYCEAVTAIGDADLVPCSGCQRGLVPPGTHTASLVILSDRKTRPRRIRLAPEFRARYELTSLAGVGASGSVYVGTDTHRNVKVAVKLLLRAEDAYSLERFVREGRMLARLRHNCVTDVIECGQMDGHPYIVTEYLDGGTLRDKLDERVCLSPVRALPVMQDIVGGLEALHLQGIVHRDLKPENIFLTYFGRAKIGDLGLAKDYGSRDVTLTAPGAMIGTPRYMAPEQLRGEAVSVASDLYSAGAIFYEMLSGKAPYAVDNLFELIVAHRKGPPPPVSSMVRGVPAALCELVSSCLAPRPSDRPRSASDLLTQLMRLRTTRLTRSLTSIPRPPPAVPQPSLLSNLGRWLKGALAL